MVRFSTVDVVCIHSEVSRSSFSDTEIEQIADSILESGGLFQPLIVKMIGVEDFTVLHGDKEFYGALRAKEKDISKAEMVNAFVVEPGDDEALLLEQISYLKPPPVVPHHSGGSSDGLERRLDNLEISFAKTLNQLRTELLDKNRENDLRFRKLEQKLDKKSDPLSLLNTLDEQQLAQRLSRSRIPTPEKIAKLITEARREQSGEEFRGYTDVVESVKGLGDKRMLAIIDDWSRG